MSNNIDDIIDILYCPSVYKRNIKKQVKIIFNDISMTSSKVI